jgi:hypothetical protein
VGQLLTFTWRGRHLTPATSSRFTRLHAGGLCWSLRQRDVQELYWGNTQYDRPSRGRTDYYAIASTYFDREVRGQRDARGADRSALNGRSGSR